MGKLYFFDIRDSSPALFYYFFFHFFGFLNRLRLSPSFLFKHAHNCIYTGILYVPRYAATQDSRIQSNSVRMGITLLLGGLARQWSMRSAHTFRMSFILPSAHSLHLKWTVAHWFAEYSRLISQLLTYIFLAECAFLFNFCLNAIHLNGN